MHNKLVTASYIHKDADLKATAHAVSASLNTGHGLDFHVAAISQKQAFFSDGDTPRVALISFLTGLQSRKDSEIEKIIVGGVLQAAGSVHEFIRQKGGSPCSLTAAIVHDNQLYTVQIGSGKVLIRENQQLVNPNADLEKKYVSSTWLGESSEFSAENINLNKVDQLDAQSDLSVLVCQPSFANKMLDQSAEFNEMFENISAKHQVRTIPRKLAEWAKEKYYSEQLTLATIHSQTTKFVDFFTLQEALLSPSTDISSTIISSKAKPSEVIRKPDPQAESDSAGLEKVKEPQPDQNSEVEIVEIERDSKEPAVLVDSPAAIPLSDEVKELSDQVEYAVSNGHLADQDTADSLEAIKGVEQNYSIFDTIAEQPAVKRANVDISDENAENLDASESFVLFSTSQTIPTPATSAPAAAPVKPVMPVAAKEKQAVSKSEATPSASVSVNGSLVSHDANDTVSMGSKFGAVAQNLKSISNKISKRNQALALIVGTLLILSIGFLWLRGDDTASEPEEVVAVIKTSTVPPTRVSNITPNCLDSPSACITPSAAAVVVPPTATNTPLPTSTTVPTATPEPSSVLVGRVYESFSNTGKLIFPGEQVGSSAIARVVFADQSSEGVNIDEVYLLPDSLIGFGDKNNHRSFDVQPGSSLIVHSTQELVSAGIALLGDKTELNRFNVVDGCMSIDYVSEDQPVTVACYSGACAWASPNENGVQLSLDPGTQIEFTPADIAESDSASIVEPTPLDTADALNFFINLATMPTSQLASSSCLEPYLTKSTATPTVASNPTVTPIPPTAVPPTQAPVQSATSVPTAVPPTSVPPTAVPPTAVPPTSVPPTAVPPTAVPPTAVPPTAIPPTPVLPATATPTAAPPTPTAVPPTATPEQLPVRPTESAPPPDEGDQPLPPTSTPINDGG